MKLYLNCYVWGDGYTTKCFDLSTQEVTVGSRTMSEQERILFVRSNARLLLASVGTRHFGFVRQIDAEATEENGRRCMINLALSGEGDEIDAIIVMAARRYSEFAQAVRSMVRYEGAEFLLDWERFRYLSRLAGSEETDLIFQKPVALLLAEPSLDYFIKNCGMDWKETDIERQLDSAAFSERSVGMRLYLYCATPSMGYVLREIDSRTGEVLHEEKETREKIQKELLRMIDNSGCRMALFRAGSRQCFVAKDIKADTLNQYGQKKTVCLAAESNGDGIEVRRMALWALLDHDGFRTKLTDCVRISAGTVGYTVDKTKLQQFLEAAQEPEHFAQSDSRRKQWDALMQERGKPYTFLVMNTSLDYFCRSTGLDVSKQQVFRIFSEDKLDASAESPAVESGKQIRKTEINEDERKTVPNSMQRADTVYEKRTKEPVQEDAVNLLDYPAFRIIVGLLAAVLALGVILYRILK